jgi:dolichyl-diphosphooligosaccharide---protein glycosyltransferase
VEPTISSAAKELRERFDMTVEPEGILTGIRGGLSRENISTRFRAIRKAFGEVQRSTVLHYSVLTLTLGLAAIIRLLPLRWGAYISEFDPYFNFNDMRQITSNGWQSWYAYTDFKAWFPFGRPPVTTSYPGTSFTGTLFYQFLTSIGINISLYDAAVWAPVILGVFGVLVIYFFARDIWGKSAGLLAALFSAFSSSLISRTDLGFFRNEAVGIPTMVMAFLFFIRAVDQNRSLKATIIYSMLSSVSLIYMTFAWGSFRYAAEVLGLFTLAMVVLKRYSPRLTLAYGITMGFFLYTGTELPLLGHSYLTESTTIALLGIMGILAIMELARLAPTSRGRFTVVSLTVVGIAAIAIIGIATNLIGVGLRGKFLATLDPFVRNNIPLVASVAENRPSTWASLYLEIGSVILLAVFGFFFAFQRLRDSDVLLIIFGVTGFYFAASLVRLTLILAPAMATLAAITVVELGKPAMDIIQQTVIFPRRKLRFTPRVSREFSLGILLIILILVVPTFINAVQSAYTPTTIASASLPVRGAYPDWIQALTWMNNNLPSTSVVFAWWDYGYWISVNTGLHTLADNGTGNTTQIQIIATGLMLNESMASNLLRQYGVTHVAIFVSYNYQSGGSGLCSSQAGTPPVCGYGDDSKWYWMVRIGNGTIINTPLGPATVTYRQIVQNAQTGASVYYRYISIGGKTDNGTVITDNVPQSSSNAAAVPLGNTLLGLLLRNDYPSTLSPRLTYNSQASQGDPSDRGDSQPYFFTRVYESTNNYVLIYKVNYPQTPVLTTTLSNPYISKTDLSKGTNITGTLTDSNGPISTNLPVTLQYCVPPGCTSWTTIGQAYLDGTSGSFGRCSWSSTCTWTSSSLVPLPTQGLVEVRGWWNGEPALDLNMVLSANQTIIEHS